MLTEAQNFAVVQTQLDDVFYQSFEYDAMVPEIATAQTAAIFKQSVTTHAAYIEQVFKGTGLFPVVGETQIVPQSTPQVANQLTSYVKDFADSINFMCQAIARLLSKLNKFGGTPSYRTIPSQALLGTV